MVAFDKTYGEFWDYSYGIHYARGLRFRRPQDGKTPSLKAFLRWQYVPPPGSAVLDSGCGDGLNAVFLASLGYSVTGIDVSLVALERAAEYAKERGLQVQFVQGDVRDMSQFRDETFAMCVDNKTFHSLWTSEDRARYLSELPRILRPSAPMFFRQNATPAELRDEFGWTKFLGKPIDSEATPENSDTPPDGPGIWPNSMKKYGQFLRDAGFTIADAFFCNDDPDPVSVVWCLRNE